MRARPASALRVAVILCVAAVSVFAAEPPPDKDQAQRLPEHRVQPLPKDTFKPSEEISEDFPVPFPVDI